MDAPHLLADRLARTAEPWKRRELLRALDEDTLASLDLIELQLLC